MSPGANLRCHKKSPIVVKMCSIPLNILPTHLHGKRGSFLSLEISAASIRFHSKLTTICDNLTMAPPRISDAVILYTSRIDHSLTWTALGVQHCISRNDTDVQHYNFNAHQPILVMFGRDVAERGCHRTVILSPTFSN